MWPIFTTVTCFIVVSGIVNRHCVFFSVLFDFSVISEKETVTWWVPCCLVAVTRLQEVTAAAVSHKLCTHC